jgi:hypothetical protein
MKITTIVIAPTVFIYHDTDGNTTSEDGWDIRPAQIDLETDTTYDFLRMVIGGPIDCIQLPSGLDMWVGDEFLFDGSIVNPIASVLAAPTHIRGPVVLARCDAEGNTIGIPEDTLIDTLAKIKTIAEELGGTRVPS